MSLKIDIDKFIWAAMDESGDWTLFRNRPLLLDKCWHPSDDLGFIEISFEMNFNTSGFKGNYKDSLHKKVKGRWVRVKS